jgi:hypothetical protein
MTAHSVLRRQAEAIVPPSNQILREAVNDPRACGQPTAQSAPVPRAWPLNRADRRLVFAAKDDHLTLTVSESICRFALKPVKSFMN